MAQISIIPYRTSLAHVCRFGSGRTATSSSCAIHFRRRQFTTHVDKNPLPSGGHCAHLYFTGSKKHPILNPPAIKKLISELETLAKDEELRTLFLRSTIAGADITHMKDIQTAQEAQNFIRSIDKLCSLIQEVPNPVIAVIDGPCLGAGMEVAASCDMRIGVKGAKTVFAMPETRIGIPSVVQACLLPGLIGWGRTRQLLYFGQELQPERALEWGFLNEIVEKDELSHVLAKWGELIDQSESKAVAAQKALMRVWETEGTGRAAIETSVAMFGDAFKTEIPRKIMGDYYAKMKARKNS